MRYYAVFDTNVLVSSMLTKMIRDFGLSVTPSPTSEILIDTDDLIFYEVVMEKRNDNAYLITGNIKHFPVRSYIVTPSEMMEILKEQKSNNHIAFDTIAQEFKHLP